jgi:signal transduction histidine kinase/ActR/RegA family two-component response regulator
MGWPKLSDEASLAGPPGLVDGAWSGFQTGEVPVERPSLLPMPSPDHVESLDDALIRDLRRWRHVLVAAALTIAAVVSAGFAAERLATRWIQHTGNVLRQATSAQRDAWEAEAELRRLALRAPEAAFDATLLRAEEDSVRQILRALRDTVADNSEQGSRVDSLAAAFERWHAVFAAPILAGQPITRSMAIDGTAAFDVVMAHFDAIVAEETRLRTERFARQSVLLWSAFGLCVALLAIVALAVGRLARGLEVKAVQAAEHQHLIEDQATELESQAAALEEQAAQLEEQAEELRQRVAERDETNRLLQQASTFLDSALESAPFGIAFYDRGLRFQRINAALARINGAPADAHLGRRIEEMIPAIAPQIRPILEQVLSTGEASTDVIIEGTTPADPTRPRRWLVTYYPIRQPGAAPVGVGCMVLDVTDQYRLEQQLRQAQKLEAVGRLAGGIAHDFNNVLTVIQSYAEVLAFELGEEDRSREEVEAIRAAADRAAALARQLLAFSRRDVIITRDVDVRDVVRSLELILRRLVSQGVELTLSFADEPLIVRIDAGQLEQVVMNLTINAVDAMPDGGRLTVAIERAAGPNGGPPRARIRVEDTGTGMSTEVQERLFEPFFTTKPAGRGTGLGLATTYAIVHEAGGEITLESRPGAGTRFDIWLPLSSATEADALRRLSPVRGTPTARGTEVILLAEDEPAIRTALSRILRSSGYRVIEASNGGEALRLAATESGPIDLLLTDVMMPGIGGKELVRRLREHRPSTRVILMSGYTDDADLRADLGSARFTFLQKPFAARQVVAAVRDALDAPSA